MPTEYVVRYERTMTIESVEPLTTAQLREMAQESLHAAGALWNVVIDGKTYPLRADQ